ncbi:PTS sugar transporter subunit IIC [Leuconostoc carnosum]|uniref:PTS sugar transporter subunit IIC n=1 Tax=Leuconostoc carnosum TaxID=1252 RepID=UPI000D51D0C3|nr:PTS sugar transporter subunit IIC [Leuconostoc carnosum]KAA8366375.1 PTS sugar transporter subunit IIC [Leuconostoc carnosum]KAA8369668.1 PTS sugar transporter subunit IIC [Leuconostoc carnosum]KAA8371758.1 PTS sugar transporter subunit IIC [Leuconostoc carnosum]KAA8372229.1 PTS sugar transporter subunit IIC [Leuconostoc carnosum]KAA8375115.1 PTS sugar transporter subunit IIC [Leuconostoc carnosum]
MSIKADGHKWASKESQEVRNEEYARKATEIATVEFSGATELRLKDFFFKVLSGSAQGILIGVLPSAVMKYIIQYSGLGATDFGANLSAILTLFTSLIPFLIGMAVALQFKMKSLDVGVVAVATAVASGSIKWATAPAGFTNPVTGLKSIAPANVYIASGAGDVINAMIVAAIAVLVTWLVSRYLKGFGSVAIILSPIIVGGGVGLIGKYIAPYVGLVTTEIGDLVATFTKLAPIPMSILIAMAFAIIIITPVSTVGIALAISLSGIGSGAAAMGVVATTIVLLINSWRVNKPGVTIAIALGAMKGMMPSVFAKPVTMLPFLLTAAISGIPVALFNIQGTPVTAGFGYIGLVSPIQSMVKDPSVPASVMNHFINPIVALIAWLIVPIIAGFIAQFVFSKLLKLYSPMDFQQDL